MMDTVGACTLVDTMYAGKIDTDAFQELDDDAGDRPAAGQRPLVVDRFAAAKCAQRSRALVDWGSQARCIAPMRLG
jgi:hypothetical protein